MGYQEITIPTGRSIFTVTFKQIGSTDGYDIQNARLYTTSGVEYDTGSDSYVDIMKMKTDGNGGYDTTQQYPWKHRDGKANGWYRGANPITGAYFKDGEAVCINNKSGGELRMRMSGEVEVNPVSMELIAGRSLVGNMTPVKIDIQGMRVYTLEGIEHDTGSSSNVDIVKMTSDGKGGYDDGQMWPWKHRSGKDNGWYSGSSPVTGIYLEPGEAVCINNKSGQTLILKFPNPMAK